MLHPGTLARIGLAATTLCAACALRGKIAPAARAPTPDIYADVDAHALAAPPEARASVEALAAYLCPPSYGETEKARAIFRWLTANIQYQGNVTRARAVGGTAPGSVLARGRAACGGFSSLFAALAHAADLEATTIVGYSKGYGHAVGETFGGDPDHAWNAVRVGGRWQLVDCTWGAGVVEHGVYVRRFEPFFFLPAPADLRLTHFPLEPEWQLLEPPITLSDFAELPFVRVPYFLLRLELLSHPRSTIETADSLVRIRIRTPPEVDLAARVAWDGGPLGESGVSQQSERGRHLVTVASASPDATAVVRIYARDQRDQGPGLRVYDWALDYRVLFGAATRRNGP